MASAVIHMCVASEINKKINKDNSQILIGTIVPDISKYIGETKVKSHFLDEEKTEIPNIEKFLNKYQNSLNNDFVLGYYIHLYTDYLWFKYFFTEITDGYKIKKIDGTIINCNEKDFWEYIYSDYTNLDRQLLDEYNLNCKIFYNEIPNVEYIIDEIPMDKISLIINQTGIIVSNSKLSKEMIFDLNNVKKFISTCTDLIISNLKEIGVI